MKTVATLFRRLWDETEAEVAIEYGLLVALVALGLVTVFNLFGDQIGTFFSKITNRIANCPEGNCE
jgi:Flp pilus assembly pilin Flp